jgi:hypothetical protein
MDSDPMQPGDPEDNELARRLEAYADARLSPEDSAATRMRANVMATAHRQAVLARADADRLAAAARATARADRTRRSAWRRPMTALLAAGLTLAVGVGSVSAAQAGGPLYDVRIWTETLTLPAGANERAQAELRRLESRLSEAAAATAAGDTNAADAALEAYGAIVREATLDATGNAAASATLDEGMRHNIEVLTLLVDRVPEQARDAIQHAIDRSGSARKELKGHPAAEPTKGPRPGATDRPARTPNPNRPTNAPADPKSESTETPKPHPTPKPNPTPKPHPPPKADATPEANAEPAATPTEKPKPTPRGGRPSDPPGNRGGNPGI